MTSAVFDLTARSHPSRVLGEWMAAGGAGVARSIQAAGENSTTTGLSGDELSKVLGLTNLSTAGVRVDAGTAMRVSTVYGCVSLVAGAISSLPIGVFERQGNDRAKVDHDYWWIFNEQANEEMTAATAWEMMVASHMFEGDAIAELLRPSIVSSRVIGWQPLHPWCVQPFRDTDDRLYYRVQPRVGAAYVLDQADVLHIPSLGFDGLTSPSPITYAAREAIGISLAAEGYNAKFFGEGATFDYALKTAGKLDKDQLAALRTSLLTRMTGGKNSRSPLILTGGLEPAQVSVNPKDAEILATRLFEVEEICRILGVPPHMVGHTNKTTSFGSGIAEQGISFVRYTLRRRLNAFAQELNRKLWPTRARFFVEHNTAALESGDLKARNEAYRIAIGRAGEPGWMTPNQVRRYENMPPMDGGDTLNNGAGNAKPTTQAAG